MTNQAVAIPPDYVLAIHELGHAWAFHNAGQRIHHVALGPMKNCSVCKTLPAPLNNSAQAALNSLNTQEYAHLRQPAESSYETLEQNLRCSLAGAAAQEVCSAVNIGEYRHELDRVVDILADADFIDIEDTLIENDKDWEFNEELQDGTDQLLRLVYSNLLDELPAEKLKTMAELLVRKRLLLAAELSWDSD
jgi:hypothetical protein